MTGIERMEAERIAEAERQAEINRRDRIEWVSGRIYELETKFGAELQELESLREEWNTGRQVSKAWGWGGSMPNLRKLIYE